MQNRAKSLFRGAITGVIALGFMGTAAISTPVAAQGVICVDQPSLALADRDDNGTVTIAEIDRVIELSGNNADLQAARDQAVAAGVTGLQYTGCTPGDGTTDPTPAPTAVPGDGTTDPTPAPTAVPGDGTTDPTPAPGDGDDDGDDNGDGQTPGGDNSDGDGTTAPGAGDDVTDLPETGDGQVASNSASWLMMAVGSAMAATGAFLFRTKKA